MVKNLDEYISFSIVIVIIFTIISFLSSKKLEKNGNTNGVFFQMDEKIVENLIWLPYTRPASDGSLQQLGKGGEVGYKK